MEQKKSLRVKDHLVSGETFEVHWQSSKWVARTLPQPPEDELSKYYASDAYISHQKKTRSFADFLYRIAREWMMKKKEAWIKPFLNPNAKILDFGCGTGTFLNHLNSKGYHTYGIEPSSVARSNAPQHLNIASSLEEQEGVFDFISLWHVLEHIPDPQNTLLNVLSKLSPDGCVVIALPNFLSWDAKHYGSLWAAWDVPRHLWHFSPKGISDMMRSLGCEKIHQRGMPLDALYISYLSEKHKGKSFPLITGIIKGLYSNMKGLTTKHNSSQIYFFKKKR